MVITTEQQMNEAPKTILLVEDEEAHAVLITRAFEEHHACWLIERAKTLKEAKSILASKQPALMLVDFKLPDGEGMELLPGTVEGRLFPIVMMTAFGDEKLAVQALKAGALDYVVKSDLKFADMPHTVERALREWDVITAHKKSKASLQKMSQAINQAGESIIITDINGVIEYVNPAFTELTGYAPEEAIGQTTEILKSGKQDASFYEEMMKTISNGNVWRGKVIDMKKDGDFYPAMLTISPVKNTSGETINFVSFQSDLSALDNLTEQFFQAQKMEAIGTLVGGIAHDFNNMLAGMTGNLYLVKKQMQENPDVIQKLENVEALSFRAADMIKQLLTFARKDQVSMKPFPLATFIKETLKFIRTSVPENINVHQYICSDAALINGDATQIHQMLLNLINNARDAVENETDPSITIRLGLFKPDALFLRSHPSCNSVAYARLSVEDNGMGIPQRQIEHIFEPFFTSKEEGKGTGLGLSMVFGAIETHHGFVEVDSTEGKGSSFHVYIPLLQTEKVITVAEPEKQAIPGHGELILLVDDQPQIITTGKEVLESLGYQVLTACNGSEALDLFQQHAEEIGLCILDVVMPILSGVKAAQSIRQIKPNMKIIFSTGYDKSLMASLEKEIMLTKPYTIPELSQLIRNQLDC